jgi:lysozyme
MHYEFNTETKGKNPWLLSRKMKLIKWIVGTAGFLTGAFYINGIMSHKEFKPSGSFSNLEQSVQAPQDVNKPEQINADPELIIDGINYDSLIRDLMDHEEIREGVYPDAGGSAVGVGFNLGNPGAKERIEGLGLNYQAVCNGRQNLTHNQIYRLMAEDLETATSDAKDYVGEKWGSLHPDAKEIVVNMAYNLGKPRLSQFKRLKGALNREDYTRAAKEMKSSRWYNQTGPRARELISRMGSIDSRN